MKILNKMIVLLKKEKMYIHFQLQKRFVQNVVTQKLHGGYNKPVVLMKLKHVSLSVLNVDTHGENTIKRIVYEKI